MDDQSPAYDKRKVLKILGAFLIVLTFLAVATLASEIKGYGFIGTDARLDTITVSGEGETFAIPDVAEFSFSVHKEAKTVPDAQSQSAEAINAITSYLREGGVEERDIKTVSYSVNPRYEYPEIRCIAYPCPQPGTRELVGYEVNQSIRVKVRDTDTAGQFLSGVGERGATDVSGITFSIDDDDALQEEARNMAIKDAREKAAKLAGELDVQLVRVVSFSESGNFPIYDSYAFGKGGGVAMERIVPEIPVGENKIVSNVTITYQIK